METLQLLFQKKVPENKANILPFNITGSLCCSLGFAAAGAHLGAALRDGSALLELKLAHSNMGPDGASARTHTIENGPRSK